jgi:hypothetical protein
VNQRPNTNTPDVIKTLVERWRDGASAPSCKLGRESLSRRGGACSACTWPVNNELDQAVAHLINTAIYQRAGGCPYRIIASHLLAGLSLGPEAFRARGVGRRRIDPRVKLRQARFHVRAVLGVCGLSREDIAALSPKGNRWYAALSAVLLAEGAIDDALQLFELQTQARSSPRGRTGALHYQALTRALARAWRVLTGRLPAKNNVKFHELLRAAATTIFGPPSQEPDWESLTKGAVEHIRKDVATRA